MPRPLSSPFRGAGSWARERKAKVGASPEVAAARRASQPAARCSCEARVAPPAVRSPGRPRRQVGVAPLRWVRTKGRRSAGKPSGCLLRTCNPSVSRAERVGWPAPRFPKARRVDRSWIRGAGRTTAPLDAVHCHGEECVPRVGQRSGASLRTRPAARAAPKSDQRDPLPSEPPIRPEPGRKRTPGSTLLEPFRRSVGSEPR
jgi:hypothetical protein